MAKKKSSGAASAAALLADMEQTSTAQQHGTTVMAAAAAQADTGKDIPVISTNRATAMRKAMEYLNDGAGQSVRHRKSIFGTLGEQRKQHIPLPNIALQYLMGMYGIVYPGMMELIGDADTGKSTIAIELAGSAMLHLKAEVLLINCENKEVSQDRALLALHRNPEVAQKLINRVGIVKAFTLPQFEDVLRDWVLTMREVQKLPLSIPLFVIVDPWSALMTKEEAIGEFQYLARKEPGEKMRPTGEGTNLGHSQWAHKKGRKLPAFLDINNVFVLLVNHQTVDIDMSGNASYAPKYVKDANNANAIGGKAWKQRALLTIVLAVRGHALDADKKPIGKRIIAKVHKNSYGPSYRTIMYDHLVVHDERDKDNYLDPALHFESGFCQMLAEKKVAGIRVNNDVYSIDFEDLKFGALSAADLFRFVQEHPPLRAHVAKVLNIAGYEDILKQLDRNAAAIANIDAPRFPEAETPKPKSKKASSKKAKAKK